MTHNPDPTTRVIDPEVIAAALAEAERKACPVKIYLATSGEYSDYRVVRAFTNQADAEAYELGDSVEEIELLDGPAEVVDWHKAVWHPERRSTPNNPAYWERTERVDAADCPMRPKHTWHTRGYGDGPYLVVEGRDMEAVRKVYSEQRAQYIARKDMGVAG